jgi:hypothetical protein
MCTLADLHKASKVLVPRLGSKKLAKVLPQWSPTMALLVVSQVLTSQERNKSGAFYYRAGKIVEGRDPTRLSLLLAYLFLNMIGISPRGAAAHSRLACQGSDGDIHQQIGRAEKRLAKS